MLAIIVGDKPTQSVGDVPDVKARIGRCCRVLFAKLALTSCDRRYIVRFVDLFCRCLVYSSDSVIRMISIIHYYHDYLSLNYHDYYPFFFPHDKCDKHGNQLHDDLEEGMM